MNTPDLDPDLEAMKPQWHALDFIGLALGLVPFMLSYSTTTRSSSSFSEGGASFGTETVKHMDYVALAGGAGAILCALLGLAFIAKMRKRPPRLAVFVGLLALGSLQILRGVLAVGASAFI